MNHPVWALVALLSACSPPDDPTPSLVEQHVSGTGASLPAPVYAAWGRAWHEQAPTHLSYRATSSGEGLAAIEIGRVDFGATDQPVPLEALEAADLLQFPALVGAIVPVVNLPEAPDGLVLDLPLLARIFQGNVTRWDDPAIAALNPDVELPGRDIVTVHRADASGTTWIATHCLADASPSWARVVGSGAQVPWPAGVEARDADQLLDFVTTFTDTLAFVDLAHVLDTDLAVVRLRHDDGTVVAPTPTAVEASAATSLYLGPCTAPSGGWPLTSPSFLLVPRHPRDPSAARALLAFLDWALTDGGTAARSHGYAPLPPTAAGLVRSTWVDVQGPDGPLWSPPRRPREHRRVR